MKIDPKIFQLALHVFVLDADLRSPHFSKNTDKRAPREMPYRIADSRVPHALLLEISTKEGIGTGITL